MGGLMGSLRVIELQLVAFILVFSASGLVPQPLIDLVFPAFTSVYLLALARWAFPSHGRANSGPSQEIFLGRTMFRIYVILGTSIGLFLPLAYVLGGFARRDEHEVRSATPHLFLLSFQILIENIISGLSLFSPPMRALVPLVHCCILYGESLLSLTRLTTCGLRKNCLPMHNSRTLVGYGLGGSLHAVAKTAEDKRSAAINQSQPTEKKTD